MPISAKHVLTATTALVFMSGAAAAQPLMTPETLSGMLGDENLVIVDIRAGFTEDSAETFAEGHVPGAVYANYGSYGWRAEVDGVVGQLPPVADIEAKIQALGVDADDHVVIVNAGHTPLDMGAGTRVYWTFKALGHDNVSLLFGGFKAWEEGGFEVATGESAMPEAGDFVADFQPDLLADAVDVEAAMIDATDLIDARPVGYYYGESQASMVARPGTVPTAVNMEIFGLLENEGGALIDANEALAQLESLGSSLEAQQITFCNTGHYASVAWFVLSEIAGDETVSMYDGSMTDWSMVETRPMHVNRTTTGG